MRNLQGAKFFVAINKLRSATVTILSLRRTLTAMVNKVVIKFGANVAAFMNQHRASSSSIEQHDNQAPGTGIGTPIKAVESYVTGQSDD
jgi:hypothetical protein